MQCTLEQQERVNQMKAKAQANMKQILDFVLKCSKVGFFIVTDDNLRVSVENVSVKQNGLGAIIFTDTLLKSSKFFPKNPKLNKLIKPDNNATHISFQAHQTPTVDSLGFSTKPHSD